MATTTNYGWVTPDDTALVKDGAAAIRTLGSSVDTSFVDLLGGTTGQVLTKASGTNLDFTFTTPTANSMTLLSTTTLSGASTTISSISQSFEHLQIYIYGVTNATADGVMFCDSANGATLLDESGVRTSNPLASPTVWAASNSAGGRLSDDAGAAASKVKRTDANNFWVKTYFNYSSTTTFKSQVSTGSFINGNSAPTPWANFGGVSNNLAINAIKLSNSGGNLSTGTVEIYGIK